VFAFTCFDGTRGAGRILDDMGAAARCSSRAPVRCVTCGCRQYAAGARPGRLRLDQGIPFEPCFNSKRRRGLLRGSVSAWLCVLRFPSSGRGADADGARVARPRSLHSPERTGSIEVSHAEVASRVETRMSRAPGSNRSNPRPGRSLRNRKARRIAPLHRLIRRAPLAIDDRTAAGACARGVP